ncbi:MAG: SDR family NAD(P)-dependent oxidoreductase [Myxococcota bacterium]
MPKSILITGASDGIGRETAKAMVSAGHRVLLHGRNPKKLKAVEESFASLDGSTESYVADLSVLTEVDALANAVAERHEQLDVLINNAGILSTSTPVLANELDLRFVVNTLAPVRLTNKLLPLLGPSARILNLSSAAQSTVDLDALAGRARLADFEAYAQSKLALTMWSRHLAQSLGDRGPVVIAVNPGSLLGTKMVKEAFGRAGKDIQIGADILCRLSFDEEFNTASGQYFDNDAGRLGPPHPDALDPRKVREVVQQVEKILAQLSQQHA